MLKAFLLLTAVLIVFGILATLPYNLIRSAWENCRRMDGTFSRLRAKTEAKKLISFSAELLMVPILVFGLGGAALIGIHTYVIPIPLLEQVIGLFDPSFQKWDENMESGQYGDVGRTYGEFGESAGYSDRTSYAMRKTLKHYWYVFALLLVAFGLFLYWFTTAYYIHVVDDYRKGVFSRQTDYTRVDERRLLEQR